jgi:hypothetical protein
MTVIVGTSLLFNRNLAHCLPLRRKGGLNIAKKLLSLRKRREQMDG